MTLQQWVQEEQARERGAITRLALASGLHYTTTYKAVRDNFARSMDAAKRFSRATGGKVSVAEALGLPSERREPEVSSAVR